MVPFLGFGGGHGRVPPVVTPRITMASKIPRPMRWTRSMCEPHDNRTDKIPDNDGVGRLRWLTSVRATSIVIELDWSKGYLQFYFGCDPRKARAGLSFQDDFHWLNTRLQI